MKKFIALVLVAIMCIVVLAGCGKSEEEKAMDEIRNALREEMGEDVYNEFLNEMQEAAEFEKQLQEELAEAGEEYIAFAGDNQAVQEAVETIELDPFDESIFGADKTVDVELDGIDPFIWCSVYNHADYSDPVSGIKYQTDLLSSYKNGDVVTVTATLSDNWARQGYVLTRTETTIAVEGFDTYVSETSQLTSDFLRSVSDRAYQESVSLASVQIYDDDGGDLTPWDSSFENIHAGDTALLRVSKYMDYGSNALLVPVYKTVICDDWYDMTTGETSVRTWEDVFTYYVFRNIIVHPDGTVSYDTDYVEANGGFTSMNVANERYLNYYRDNYDFIEVPLP